MRLWARAETMNRFLSIRPFYNSYPRQRILYANLTSNRECAETQLPFRRIDEAAGKLQQILYVGVFPRASRNQEIKQIWQVRIIRSMPQLVAHTLSHGLECNALADIFGHLHDDFSCQNRDCGKFCCEGTLRVFYS